MASKMQKGKQAIQLLSKARQKNCNGYKSGSIPDAVPIPMLVL